MKEKNTQPTGAERLSIAKVIADAAKMTDFVDAAALEKLTFPPTMQRSNYKEHGRHLAAKFK